MHHTRLTLLVPPSPLSIRIRHKAEKGGKPQKKKKRTAEEERGRVFTAKVARSIKQAAPKPRKVSKVHSHCPPPPPDRFLPQCPALPHPAVPSAPPRPDPTRTQLNS
jgi:hypothetical protein